MSNKDLVERMREARRLFVEAAQVLNDLADEDNALWNELFCVGYPPRWGSFDEEVYDMNGWLRDEPVDKENIFVYNRDANKIDPEKGNPLSYKAYQTIGIIALSGPCIKVTDPEVMAALERLLTDQEPLGEEFEAVWDDNIDDLYRP